MAKYFNDDEFLPILFKNSEIVVYKNTSDEIFVRIKANGVEIRITDTVSKELVITAGYDLMLPSAVNGLSAFRVISKNSLIPGTIGYKNHVRDTSNDCRIQKIAKKIVECGKIAKNKTTTKDVHTEHCCKNCGCKYGEEDLCTVVRGIKKQSFECGTTGVCSDTYECGKIDRLNEQLED